MHTDIQTDIQTTKRAWAIKRPNAICPFPNQYKLRPAPKPENRSLFFGLWLIILASGLFYGVWSVTDLSADLSSESFALDWPIVLSEP